MFHILGLKGCHCQVYGEQYVFIVINDRNVCFHKFARVVHVSLRKISRLAVLLPGPYLGRLADCQLRTTPLRRYSSCTATFAYSRFILNPNNLIIPAKFLFQIESRLVPISTHLQCTNKQQFYIPFQFFFARRLLTQTNIIMFNLFCPVFFSLQWFYFFNSCNCVCNLDVTYTRMVHIFFP